VTTVEYTKLHHATMHVLLLKHASIAYKTVRLPAYCHSVTCDEIRALVKVFSNVSQKTVNVTRSKHTVVRIRFLSQIFRCLPVMPNCGQHFQQAHS